MQITPLRVILAQRISIRECEDYKNKNYKSTFAQPGLLELCVDVKSHNSALSA